MIRVKASQFRSYLKKTKRVKIPKAPSKLEETFALHLFTSDIEEMPEREYRFCPGRKFAFDFAWPSKKLAVECEGGTKFGKSRHSQGKGFEDDAVKYNTAQLMGWKVLRFTMDQIQSMYAIKATREALGC